MKYPEALQELIDLIHIRDRGTVFQKAEDRLQALYGWMDKYVAHIEESQLVTSAKNLTTEQSDKICYKILHDSVDKLMEERIVKFIVEDHRYTVELVALKSFKHEKRFKK